MSLVYFPDAFVTTMLFSCVTRRSRARDSTRWTPRFFSFVSTPPVMMALGVSFITSRVEAIYVPPRIPYPGLVLVA